MTRITNFSPSKPIKSPLPFSLSDFSLVDRSRYIHVRCLVFTFLVGLSELRSELSNSLEVELSEDNSEDRSQYIPGGLICIPNSD